ncbi:hypothetical protein Halru_3161 [Halovivax ruber XH-70]|uniref:Uncharacterized protein n=1 Tax=Halovivax ruber (strain DSM 18193 / JCM 13892 / XH-70) TaxID=797302 RepID=L0IIC3_HALRX|nr:hypothetical protein [Halovivax ruber]AGB17727.1 hypothetical protein Halru_3161 [Halovivax ruber XH-70]
MTQRTRRRFLAVAGALGVSATAGCLSGDESDPDDGADEGSDDGSTDDGPDGDANSPDDSGSTDESSTVEGTLLGDITVDNLHDATHTVDVQVEINGSMESWVSKEIESRTGSVALDRSWDAAGGEFRVRVRLDGTEFVEVTPADWNSPDCLSLIVVIDQSGALRVAGDTTSGFCAQ